MAQAQLSKIIIIKDTKSAFGKQFQSNKIIEYYKDCDSVQISTDNSWQGIRDSEINRARKLKIPLIEINGRLIKSVELAVGERRFRER